MTHADVNAKITLENKLGDELRRAGATLRRWVSEEATDGPAALAPNAIVAFGPQLVEDFETTPADEARPELVEAARTILAFEDELADAEAGIEGRPPCIPDHGVPVWCPGCAWDGDRDPWGGGASAADEQA